MQDYFSYIFGAINGLLNQNACCVLFYFPVYLYSFVHVTYTRHYLTNTNRHRRWSHYNIFRFSLLIFSNCLQGHFPTILSILRM